MSNTADRRAGTRAPTRVGLDVNRLTDRATRHSGISRYTRELAVELTGVAGVEVVPIVSSKRHQHGVDREDARADIIEQIDLEPRFGTRLEHFDPHGALPWDVYHTPVGPLPGLELTGDCPRLITVHDCLHLKFPELHPNPTVVPAIRKALDSILTDRDHALCVSDSTRRDLHEFLEIERPQVCVIAEAASDMYHAADAAWAANLRASLELEQDAYLVALCQADPRKNIDTLLSAFATAYHAGRINGMTLAAVCSTGYAGTLTEWAARADLPPSAVRVITDVNDRVLAGLYAGAAFSVYVPLYEGFGLPPLESMAAGCPVLVSGTSSLPEVVADAGLYASPNIPESIADGLATLARSEDARDTLRHAAIDRARGFTWRRTAEETADYYRYMLEHRAVATAGAAPVVPLAPASTESTPWAPAIARWMRSKSGVLVLFWAFLVAIALASPGAIALMQDAAPWWIGASSALAGLAAAALLVVAVPYLMLRAQRDARPR
ncbi:MAG: glycosyltransferase family 1 protein [Planctomycetota bacterium]